MFRRRDVEALALIREDFSAMMVYLMELDAKVTTLLDYFEIDDGEAEEEADH